MRTSFYFYDLETSGLNPRGDRIMQFAGQRTDEQFQPVGEPTNLLIELAEDTLPSPSAIMVTGITPQLTRTDGVSEREFCRFLTEEVARPGTTIVGYNSVRFDDEFVRHTLWRNFYDPYEWQWKEDRSRWDLLDVVRLTRALRPDGIEWPVTDDGRPTNRLELLTKLNHIEHEHAHDALADVMALIAVTKLIQAKQPQLFDYLYQLRDKRAVGNLVNLEQPQPFVYASGRYPAAHNHTTVAYPIAPGPNGSVLVYDLRYNLDELLEQERQGRAQLAATQAQTAAKPTADDAKADVKQTRSGSKQRSFHDLKPWERHYFPIVKKLQLNRCPAVAPLGVLSKHDGWARIALTPEQIQENLASLRRHPEFVEQMAKLNRPDFPKAPDVESALYDGFVDGQDRILCATVRNNFADDLSDYHPPFQDERLPELLLHYKAKNFPSSLAADEVERWEAYRTQRLEQQTPGFIKDLERIQNCLNRGETFGKSADECAYLLEELKLWYQSIAPEATDK